MSDITAVFIAGTSLLSRGIMAFTHSNVSHCALGWTNCGVPMLVHGTSRGVIPSNRRRWLAINRERVVNEFVLPRDRHDAIRKALEMVDLGYDYRGFFRLWANEILRPLRLRIRHRRLLSVRSAVCSKMLALAAFPGLDPDEVTAEDVQEECFREHLVRLPTQ